MSLPEQVVATLSSLRGKLPEAPVATPEPPQSAAPARFDSFMSASRDGVRIGLPRELANHWEGQSIRLEALSSRAVRLYLGDCATEHFRTLDRFSPRYLDQRGLHFVNFTRGMGPLMGDPFGRTRTGRCRACRS